VAPSLAMYCPVNKVLSTIQPLPPSSSLPMSSSLFFAVLLMSAGTLAQTPISCTSTTNTCNNIQLISGSTCSVNTQACETYFADPAGICTCQTGTANRFIPTEPITGPTVQCEEVSTSTLSRLSCDCDATDTLGNFPITTTGSDVINTNQGVGLAFEVVCGEFTVSSFTWRSRFLTTADEPGFFLAIYALSNDNTVDPNAPVVVFDKTTMSPPFDESDSLLERTITPTSGLNNPMALGRYVVGMGCIATETACSFTWRGVTNGGQPASVNNQLVFEEFIFFQSGGQVVFNSTMKNAFQMTGSFTGSS